MILGVPPRPGLRILMASKQVDFRKYAANIIMRNRGPSRARPGRLFRRLGQASLGQADLSTALCLPRL